jgi:hypothetical protein
MKWRPQPFELLDLCPSGRWHGYCGIESDQRRGFGVTLKISPRTRLQLRLRPSLIGWFHGYTHRLEMTSLTFMFLELGWVKQRADYPRLAD